MCLFGHYLTSCVIHTHTQGPRYVGGLYRQLDLVDSIVRAESSFADTCLALGVAICIYFPTCTFIELISFAASPPSRAAFLSKVNGRKHHLWHHGHDDTVGAWETLLEELAFNAPLSAQTITR